ncbi:uncharacterized protein LOC128954400 [Oppia nitens]|uniref:uncharacterized protein LOC128954400 n=1 Tax=Oppia nitens TaxID=1686743 RepID=UPI0023DBE5CD|nr:uncharacterized protein LOC128954400 [Oppia nitens]
MKITTYMTTAKDSFDRFGDDLCQLLLQYFQMDDRLRLQSVSKQWLALIFTTQTDLVFDDKLLKLFGMNSFFNKKQTLKLFKSIVKKCPNITTVTINDFTADYFKLLTNNKYCSRLTHISLNHNYYHYHNSYGKSFVLFCQRFGQQLQTFKINGKSIKGGDELFHKCIDSFRNLKTLDITTRDRSMGLDVIFADNKSYILPKTMQSLTLGLDNNFIKLFTKFTDIYGQQIKSLNLLVYDKLKDEHNFKTLTAGLSQMQQLKQLAISLPVDFGTDQTIQLLTTIGRRCRQVIEFSYTSKVSGIDLNKIFVSIAEHMSPQLRRLSVDCYHKYDEQFPLTSDSLKRLHRLTHLTLHVYNWLIIGDCFLSNLHRNLPRLQYIKCDYLSITQKSITALGQLAHLMDVYLLCDINKLKTSESFLTNHLVISSKYMKNLFITYWSSNESKRFIYGKYLNDYNLNVNYRKRIFSSDSSSDKSY